MKRFTPSATWLVLAAALAGLGTGALATPALAKKDDKAAANPNAPALKLSPDVLKQAQVAQPAIQAGNYAAAEPAVAAIEAGAKNDDDKYIAAVFRLQIAAGKLKAAPAGQSADESALRAPLETLVANPKTPASSRPQYAYQLGAIAFNAGDNAAAIRYFTQAKQLGYNDPQLDLAMIKAKFATGDNAGATADIDARIKASEAAGQKAPEELYRYAIGQNIKTNKPVATEWLQRWVSAYPTVKNWHDALTIYGLQQGSIVTPDRDGVVDLFRLMRATKSLDQYGYEEYADKVLKAGLPDEAKTVIAEGRASGKIPATSSGAAGIVTDANKSIALEGPLASLDAKAKASATGALAQQTGDAYLGKGDYAKAIDLYRLALTKGSVKTDLVNTHLGIALAMTGDKAGARTAFNAVTGTPSAGIAQFWVVSLDHPATA